jgi:hypothetical protein
MANFAVSSLPMPSRFHICAVIAALAGSTLLTTLPATGQPAIPVEIKTCSILPADPTTTARPFWFPFGPVVAVTAPIADGVRISFVNHARLTADRVLFAVNYRGDIQRIVDAGTFAPEATIDHTFGTFSGDAFLGPNPNACAVTAVRYVDHTFWRAAP